MGIFNFIVGCSNIIACIVSIISLIKVSQINGKLNSDNKSQKVKIEGNSNQHIHQVMGSDKEDK